MRRPDFKAAARELADGRWDSMTEDERAAAVEDAKVAWLEQRLGPEVEPPTFAAWIKDQPADVQDGALGAARARRYRAGKLKVDRYVDAARPLTLDELEARALTVDARREKT